jgi:ABC-2 type transport system ATP-binding protein
MEQPDVLTLATDRPRAKSAFGSSDLMNAALAAITAAGIPVLRFELEGARLSDAFLKMTSGAVV